MCTRNAVLPEGSEQPRRGHARRPFSYEALALPSARGDATWWAAFSPGGVWRAGLVRCRCIAVL
jgi:hypothetical protein